MTSLPTGIAPSETYLPTGHTGQGPIPAQGLSPNLGAIPKPTHGEHVVQHYGPRLTTENNLVAQPFFEYSRCCGNRKAVLIGINYIGTNNELRGCINDSRNVQKFIIEHFGYDPANIVLLTDDNKDSAAKPTKANIIKAMKWLVEGAKRDDALFFHYSGHGTQSRDKKLRARAQPKEKRLDERDNLDEAICPLDFQDVGMLIDDEIHNELVTPLPAGCRLTAIFDSCNSGSIMDIPYVYNPTGRIREPEILSNAHQGILHAGLAAIGQLLEEAGLKHQVTFDSKKAQAIMDQAQTSPADVLCWSGCRDDQTSADTFEDGQNVGAMSWAFITCLTKTPQLNYMELLVALRTLLKKERYSQIPQLSACHPIDTDLQFVA